MRAVWEMGRERGAGGYLNHPHPVLLPSREKGKIKQPDSLLGFGLFKTLFCF
jgi:hypothetical protein